MDVSHFYNGIGQGAAPPTDLATAIGLERANGIRIMIGGEQAVPTGLLKAKIEATCS
jgi:hypothetical protein